MAALHRIGTGGAVRSPGRRGPGDAGHRGDLHGLRGDHRGRPSLAVRHHPPGHDLPRVAGGRVGAGPAAQRPQPVHRRRLPRPAVGELRGDPLRAGVGLSQLSTGVRGDGPAGRDLGPYLRERPHPRRRRHRLRAGGQPPGPLGGVLPAGEPHGGQARLPRDVPPLQHRAGRPLYRQAGQPAGLGLPVHGRTDHRGADTRHLQLRLLRARLPGPAARRGAGRGW